MPLSRPAVEAVTNVARHGDARGVRVELAWHATTLTLTITDDGPRPEPWMPGVGLSGMRERAEQLGGTLRTGPTPNGRRIHATYPLGAGQ